MKNLFTFLVMCSILMSCVSYKNLTLMSDLNEETLIKAGASNGIKNYKLKINDILYINFVSSNIEMNKQYNLSKTSLTTNYEGELNKFLYGYKISEKGTVEMPLLGSFKVQGLTVAETEQLVQNKALQLFKDVVTEVNLLSYRVTVIGEVKSPGIYYSYGKTFTIIDALAKAQGITDFAMIERIAVIRNDSLGQHAIEINLNKKQSLTSEGYFLLPNDIIIVKPSKNKNRQLRSASQTWLIPSVSALFIILNFFRN